MAKTDQSRERLWASLTPSAYALAGVAAVTVAFLSVYDFVTDFPVFVAAAYVAVVIGAMFKWGTRAAVLAALAGVFIFDYFFLPPLFNISSGGWMAALLLTSVLAGHVFARTYRRARTAEADRDDIERLYRELKLEHAERERAEQALRDSEERYRIVAETATDAIITIDDQSRITFANGATERIFGYPVSALIGQELRLLMPTDMQQLHQLGLARYLQTGRKATAWHNVELRGQHHDGHEIPIEVSFGEFRRDGKHLFTGIVRDISERKKEELLRSGQGRALEMIATGAPLADTLSELARLIESQSQGMLCSALLVDEDGKRLRHGAAPSLPDAYIQAIDGAPIGPQAGSCGTAAHRGEMVTVTDIQTDPLWIDYRQLAAAHGLRACWSMPILSQQGNVMGTFAMYYRTVRVPTPSELRLISIATQIAGIAIERKRAEAALREREEQIRRLVDSNIIGVLFWDVNGEVWDANDALLRMIGYSRVDLLAGKIRSPDITPAEYHEQDRHALDELRHGGGYTPYEKEFLRQDGTRVPVLIGGTLFENSREKGVAFVLDLSERKLAEDRVRHMAQHDVLTGLPNRMLFGDRVGQAIVQAQRDRKQLAVLFIDLDHFKDINDSLGHLVGDRLLRSVARRLQRCLREGDSVARLGGDEFVICLPALTDSRDVIAIAAKVLDVLRRPFHVDNHQLHLTGSVGISLYPDNGKDAGTLMRAADTAMYHAKEKGRDNHQFFEPHLNDAARRRLTIANRLRQALQRNEFALHYQPQIELHSGRVFSAEALLRWQPPDMSMVSPTEFVKIAEETGLIVPLGEWVLRQACTQLRAWRDHGHPALRVTVNLSPQQLRRPGFSELARRVLEETGLPPDALEIEITESLLMMYSAENVTALGRLARMGVRLAVDDFGTGYSSLSYLQRFPISVLKIDKSFVSGIGLDPNDTAIVTAIIAMADSLSLKVVAEGVETPEQVAFLQARGCYAVQGYHYSKAVPPVELAKMLGKRAESVTNA